MGIKLLVEYVYVSKELVTAAFGSSEPFGMEKWAAPSLHRESANSLILSKYLEYTATVIVGKLKNADCSLFYPSLQTSYHETGVSNSFTKCT